MKEQIQGLFKDPLLVAFWLYLGKVMYQGINLYEAIFMASLVAIHAYNVRCQHKERIAALEGDAKMVARVLTMEHNMEKLNAKVDDANRAVTGLSMIKRR